VLLDFTLANVGKAIMADPAIRDKLKEEWI
jgi:hypothetical protein